MTVCQTAIATQMPEARQTAPHGKSFVEHAPNKTEAQAREVIKTWVKNAVLVRYSYDNPVTRKPVNGLRVDHTKRPSNAAP
jgi:hypothetical protein